MTTKRKPYRSYLRDQAASEKIPRTTGWRWNRNLEQTNATFTGTDTYDNDFFPSESEVCNNTPQDATSCET